MSEWIKTDDTQAVQCLSEKLFRVLDIIAVGSGEDIKYGLSIQLIDLDDYTQEQILNYIDSFGYKSISVVRELYGGVAEQVIAECIAETDWDLNGSWMFNSIDEAIKYTNESVFNKKLFC